SYRAGTTQTQSDLTFRLGKVISTQTLRVSKMEMLDSRTDSGKGLHSLRATRLRSVLHDGGSLPGSAGYTYDAAGNRTSKTAVQEASPNPVSVTSNYSYDPIYELTQAVVNGSL